MRDLERQARETERKLKEAARLPAAPAPASPAEPAPGGNTGDESLSSPSEAAPAEPWVTAIPPETNVDSPQHSDLSPTDGEAGISQHEPRQADHPDHPDHLDPQPDNGNSNPPAKSNHVDRQPA
jgi:hypothetical protein